MSATKSKRRNAEGKVERVVLTARVTLETAEKIRREAAGFDWSVTKAAGKALDKFYS